MISTFIVLKDKSEIRFVEETKELGEWHLILLDKLGITMAIGHWLMTIWLKMFGLEDKFE